MPGAPTTPSFRNTDLQTIHTYAQMETARRAQPVTSEMAHAKNSAERDEIGACAQQRRAYERARRNQHPPKVRRSQPASQPASKQKSQKASQREEKPNSTPPFHSTRQTNAFRELSCPVLYSTEKKESQGRVYPEPPFRVRRTLMKVISVFRRPGRGRVGGEGGERDEAFFVLFLDAMDAIDKLDTPIFILYSLFFFIFYFLFFPSFFLSLSFPFFSRGEGGGFIHTFPLNRIIFLFSIF